MASKYIAPSPRRLEEYFERLTPSAIETQKNKATSYHLGQLKAKLAKLRRELLTPSSSGGGGGCECFSLVLK